MAEKFPSFSGLPEQFVEGVEGMFAAMTLRAKKEEEDKEIDNSCTNNNNVGTTFSDKIKAIERVKKEYLSPAYNRDGSIKKYETGESSTAESGEKSTITRQELNRIVIHHLEYTLRVKRRLAEKRGTSKAEFNEQVARALEELSDPEPESEKGTTDEYSCGELPDCEAELQDVRFAEAMFEETIKPMMMGLLGEQRSGKEGGTSTNDSKGETTSDRTHGASGVDEVSIPYGSGLCAPKLIQRICGCTKVTNCAGCGIEIDVASILGETHDPEADNTLIDTEEAMNYVLSPFNRRMWPRLLNDLPKRIPVREVEKFEAIVEERGRRYLAFIHGCVVEGIAKRNQGKE